MSIASCISATGYVGREIGRRGRHASLILMYHRILHQDEAGGVQAGMYVEPETFEGHLKFLRKHFAIVSMEEYHARNRSIRGEEENGRPLCTLTFDDGWWDFRKNAFPLLRTYQIPATVFLPTDFIGTAKWFWTDRLTRCISRRAASDRAAGTARASGNPLVRRLEAIEGRTATWTESAIELLKDHREEEIEEVLAELDKRWAVNSSASGWHAFLTWEEVAEMGGTGLISYGSHTAGHRILTTLSREEAEQELHRSRERLIREGATSQTFIPFSYPNGNYDSEIADLVQSSGYAMAVTTRRGWNVRDADRYALRRIALHQDVSGTPAMLGCRIVNLV